MLKLKTFDTFNVEQVPILTSASGNFYRTVVVGKLPIEDRISMFFSLVFFSYPLTSILSMVY